jgi:hypothetical protein
MCTALARPAFASSLQDRHALGMATKAKKAAAKEQSTDPGNVDKRNRQRIQGL